MNIISVADNKNNQVKKHNNIIKAKGSLSNTSQKMLAMLIGMVRTDDSEFQKYALRIEDYRREIESKNKDTEFYVKQAEELMKNPFRIDKKLFNWCSMVDWGNVEGYIVFSIHNDLKPYLLNLQEHFTTYNIVNILSLRGDYTPRLYEYFLMEFNEFKSIYKKKYQKIPKSYTIEIEIDWLREHFSISKGYRYNDIKRQIIEVAKKQFKAKTDIQIDYIEEKIGRKVNSLKITIKDNNKGSNDYLTTQKDFIAYIRKNFINQNIWQGQGMQLSVSEKGRIYDKKTLKEYSKEKSLKVWETWYQLAKENKLLILK